MNVSLAILRKAAPAIGWPVHKSSLIKRLIASGANPVTGQSVRGGAPLEFPFDKLPEPFHAPLALLIGPAGSSPDCKSTISRYSMAPRSMREEADRKLNLVWRVIRLKRDGRTERQASISAAGEFGLTLSTVKRSLKLIEGRPQEEWPDLLTPAYKGRAKAAVEERIWQAYLSDYGRVEQPTAQACYERVSHRAMREGWGAMPTLKTLQRRWNELPADMKRRLRYGERALLDSIPHQERDRSGMRPLDSFNMDSRIWDVLVTFDDGRIGRPVVTACQDEATNFLLSYEITEAETGASYRRVLCQAFTTYGIPDRVRFDNTRAAANKALTAGAKSRHRFKDDGAVDGLLKRLGCEPVFAQPFNGRSKLIERAFADLKERSEREPRLIGAYTGRSPSEKPANYGDVAVPIALFAEVLAEAVREYNARPGRRSTVAYRTSFQTVFEAGLQQRPVRRLTDTQRRLFFLTAIVRTVTPSGTVLIGKAPRPHRYGFRAESDVLREFIGRDVVVRYDENDMSAPVLVETLDGRLICEHLPRLAAGRFDSAEDAGAYERERKAARRAERQVTAAHRRMLAIEAGQDVATVISPEPTPPTETKVVAGIFGRRRKPAEPAELAEVVEVSPILAEEGLTDEDWAAIDAAHRRVLADDDFPDFDRHVA